MSSEGLPVNNVVGTSVDLGARSVQDAANSASSSQNADSAAASADAAWKFSRVAQGAVSDATAAVGEAQAAADAAAASAQNATITTNLYPSLDGELGANAAIAAGIISDGAIFFVRSISNRSIADEYRNISGVATPTGDSSPATAFVNDVLTIANDAYNKNDLIGFHASTIPMVASGEEFIYAVADEGGKVLSGVTSDTVQRFYTDVSVMNATGVTMETNGNSINILGQNMFENEDYPYVVCDEVGRALFGIDTTGQLIAFAGLTVSDDAISVKNGIPTVAGQQSFSTDEYAWVICDNEMRVLIGVTNDGEVVGNISGTNPHGPTDKFIPLLAEINHISVDGQSLSIGTASGTPISAAAITGCIQPDVGVADGALSAGELIGTTPVSTGLSAMTAAVNTVKREFPTYGISNQLKAMMDADGANQYEIMGSNNGHGAYRIDQLDRQGDGSGPTPNYQLGVNQTKAYQAYASTLGKSFLTQAKVWIQGESDISAGTSKAEYKRRLANLLDDYHEDIGQNYKPCMVTYQTSSHTIRTPNHSPDIAYAQLEIANENPFFFLACSTYVFPYNSDGVHMPANSYRWMGCYIGKALHSILNGDGWKPLQPEYITRNGRVILVDFNVPTPPLVLDTTNVTNPGNYGFQVFNDSSTTEFAIQSVSIVNNTQVKIVLNSDPAQAVRVKYALGVTGTNAGPTTGARGNLRDSDNTVAYETNTLTGQPYDLANWCVIFDRKEGQKWAQ